MNLLSNAIKYRSPDQVSEISFSTRKENEKIILKVSDNGLGIDLKKYGHHVFKLRKTFHKHPESRGIGLFMIKNQIESLGGEISIESAENLGTTFTIKFIDN
jgi:sensor histidine kinase regulating citrate/malate metabolism